MVAPIPILIQLFLNKYSALVKNERPNETKAEAFSAL
jgi:hypothetical protein